MNVSERIEIFRQMLHGGVTPAMATPIDAGTGRIALEALPSLLDFLIARAVRGLFVGGTTGEGLLLDFRQRKELHARALSAVDQRVPIIVHVGAPTTSEAITLASHAAEIGAGAIAAVTPIFYPITDDALYAYYAAIAGAAPDLPLLAYDIPHMAVNGISAALASRLFRDIPSFAGLKSSNRDAQQIRQLVDIVPHNRLLLVGNESIALGSLALGADGLISGLASAVPEPLVTMTDAFFAGDMVLARRQQRLVNRLLACLPAGVRIGAIKGILEARGVPIGPPVAPLPPLKEEIWPAMNRLLST